MGRWCSTGTGYGIKGFTREAGRTKAGCPGAQQDTLGRQVDQDISRPKADVTGPRDTTRG